MFEELKQSVNEALARPAPDAKTVIAACDALANRLDESTHIPLLMKLGMSREKAAWEVAQAKRMMRAEYLEASIRTEFGEAGLPGRREYVPFGESEPILEEWKPLGVLLHISAGNVDALPVFSVIEGLLTGNVNILKLPEGESGLSEGILEALLYMEPALVGRAHVFDVRAQDTEQLKALASLADGIALYGSDEAVRAVRALAPPQTKLIEWGHRISFAYASPDADADFLRGAAHDMCFTSQLYCSSCQGIFVDTKDEGELYRFAERFLPVLEEEARAHGCAADMFAQAGASYALYTDSLEAALTKRGKVLRGAGCSVSVFSDFALTTSHKFGNCWIRPLPHGEIIERLRPYAGYLQTVALCCGEAQREQIERALIACGAVRMMDGYRMSEAYCGMPRDGEYPLRRYMKRVSMAKRKAPVL